MDSPLLSQSQGHEVRVAFLTAVTKPSVKVDHGIGAIESDLSHIDDRGQRASHLVAAPGLGLD